MSKNVIQVGILGVFPFGGVSTEIIEHGLEHLEKDGYKPVFLESLENVENFDAAELKMNWVVTVNGLPTAQYLEKEKGIPYIASFPVGMRGMRQWRKALAAKLGYNDSVEVPGCNAVDTSSPRLLLLGDPILTAGLKSYFQDILGYDKVLRAHYVPLNSVKEWFRRVLLRAQEHGLKTEAGEIDVSGSLEVESMEALEKLLEEIDLVIGDLALKPENLEAKQWIDLPEGLSSAVLETKNSYELFGKKGAAWLTEKLAACE